MALMSEVVVTSGMLEYRNIKTHNRSEMRYREKGMPHFMYCRDMVKMMITKTLEGLVFVIYHQSRKKTTDSGKPAISLKHGVKAQNVWLH